MSQLTLPLLLASGTMYTSAADLTMPECIIIDRIVAVGTVEVPRGMLFILVVVEEGLVMYALTLLSPLELLLPVEEEGCLPIPTGQTEEVQSEERLLIFYVATDAAIRVLAVELRVEEVMVLLGVYFTAAKE